MHALLRNGLPVIPLAAILVVALACDSAPEATQEEQDIAALRRLLDIPASATLERFVGFPNQMGFGQREGLTLEAVFLLPAAERADMAARLPAFRELPVPPEVQHAIDFTPWGQRDVTWEKGIVGVNDAPISRGRYRCRTAGNNLLHATQLAECAGTPMMDYVLGIAERETGCIHVRLRTRY